LVRVSSNITNNIQDIINVSSNKKEFNNFLNKLLNIKIFEISFIKILKYEFISEYEFSLYKYKIETENNYEIEIYLKLIKTNKIKQSIFCYWSQIYEEELEKKKCEKSINRILIRDKEINEYKRSIFLEIENNNTEILKYGTKIYLINLMNYIKKYNYKKSKFFIGNLEEDDILLIGIKSNDEYRKIWYVDF